MDTSDIKKLLLDEGYSAQDIIELTNIFKTQLANFNFNCASDELTAEIHKLKGGLRLMHFEAHASELEKIENGSKEKNRPLSKDSLKSFINQVTKDLDKLLAFI